MSDRSHDLKVVLNFCCVCIIWGSTFLAIKYAIDGIPPFVVSAIRYLLASVILYGISRTRNERWLTADNFRVAAISGILLSLGNALVCYVETSLPSGLVAVVIGSLPAWVILLDWKFFRGQTPRWTQVGGIAISLVGVAALTSSQFQGLGVTNLIVWIALFASILIWTLGTLTQRRATQRDSIFCFSAVQCGVGGLVVGAAAMWNQSASFSIHHIPASAMLAVLYLAIAGTVAASTSYAWLSQNSDPRLVSTYALLTPVMAVWLGWLFAGETVTIATLANTLLVISGVAFIALSGRFSKTRSTQVKYQVTTTSNEVPV